MAHCIYSRRNGDQRSGVAGLPHRDQFLSVGFRIDDHAEKGNEHFVPASSVEGWGGRRRVNGGIAGQVAGTTSRDRRVIQAALKLVF